MKYRQQHKKNIHIYKASYDTTSNKKHTSFGINLTTCINLSLSLQSYIFAFVAIVACASGAMGGLIAAAPALPLAAPGLIAHAPLLTAPAIVGHAPVAISHTPIATATHVGPALAAATITRPIATFATSHTLLGAPLAAPALLTRPALPLAAPALVAAPALAAPALAAPIGAPALLARPVLWK